MAVAPVTDRISGSPNSPPGYSRAPARRRPIAIASRTHYLAFGHEWDEIDFLEALARRTGCFLTSTTSFVSARKLGLSAEVISTSLPARWSGGYPAGHFGAIRIEAAMPPQPEIKSAAQVTLRGFRRWLRQLLHHVTGAMGADLLGLGVSASA